MKSNFKLVGVSKQMHKDGEWYTSEHSYKGRKLTIKMKEGHGAKIHIFDTERVKVIKTFRYIFCTEDRLIRKAQQYIDKLETDV
jgi:hypothetical protein